MDEPERIFVGLGNLVEKITPWLLDVGSWIFGGLIAFDLVLISPLLAVGSVDAAVRVAVAAIAFSLPLNVAGLVLLRIVKDAKDVGLDGLTRQAFQDAGVPDIEAFFPAPDARRSWRHRRSQIVLFYSLGIAALSLTATLGGLVAALWHMAWWIGAILLLMVALSALLVVVVIAHAMPPESDAEKALKRQ